MKRSDAAMTMYDQALASFEKAGAQREIEAVTKERAALVKPPGLPWWTWTGLIAICVIVLLIIAALTLIR